jgi:hypothetical protein
MIRYTAIILRVGIGWWFGVAVTAFWLNNHPPRESVAMMVMRISVAEIIYIHVSNRTVGIDWLREVDDSIFDDIGVYAVDMIGLVPAQHGIITINEVKVKFAKLISFNHISTMLDKSRVDGEVDTEFHGSFVVEMGFEALVCVVVL